MSDWRKADIRMTLWGDWWYFAGAFCANYQSPTMKAIGRLSGGPGTVFIVAVRPDESYTPAVGIGEITFVGQENETQVFITWTSSAAESFWREVETFLKQMSSLARMYRREATGQQLREVLDEYYQRKSRGERVKLKALAEAAGVNYGSLRQAKFRYEEEQREKNAKVD